MQTAAATSYLKAACDHCGKHIEFPAEGEGRSVNCPHCLFPTVLRRLQFKPATPQPTPQRQVATADPKQGITALGLILKLLGALQIVPGAFFAIAGFGMIGTSPEAANASTVAIGLGVAGVVIGFVFVRWGKRASTYWVCSHCGNRLSTREARLCAACQVRISGYS